MEEQTRMGSESSKGKARAKGTLEAEMNLDWGAWAGFTRKWHPCQAFHSENI